MSIEDKMTIDERRKYLRKMQKRYQQANRSERQQLLDEMVTVTELHRKSLIRLMNGRIQRRARSRNRGSIYGPEVTAALAIIWESLDFICAERLTPNLVWAARHLEDHGELRTSGQLQEKLSQISVSTVRRRLKGMRRDRPR